MGGLAFSRDAATMSPRGAPPERPPSDDPLPFDRGTGRSRPNQNQSMPPTQAVDAPDREFMDRALTSAMPFPPMQVHFRLPSRKRQYLLRMVGQSVTV